MFVHRLLQPAEAIAVGKAFHGANGRAVSLHSEHQASTRRLAVNDDRARATDPHLAADIGAGEAQFVPDEIRQQQARRNVGADLTSVDPAGQLHGVFTLAPK